MRIAPVVAIFVLALGVSLVVWEANAGEHILPDPTLTPGSVIQGITAEDVCTSGSARSARHVTAEVRQSAFDAYGLPEGNHTGYCRIEPGCELDHLVPLELGGSNEPSNLWPEPYDGQWNARMKDTLENHLHGLVCAGRIGLGEAQEAIRNNWVGAYLRYLGQPSPPP